MGGGGGLFTFELIPVTDIFMDWIYLQRLFITLSLIYTRSDACAQVTPPLPYNSAGVAISAMFFD